MACARSRSRISSANGGHIAVALDQRRARADAGDEGFVERPDVSLTGCVVAVDQQAAVGVERVPGEVDFADQIGGNGVEPGRGVEADIVRSDRDIVDVDQQAAAAAPRELGEEARFAPAVVAEREIMGRILDQDLAAERVLDAADVGGAARQDFVGPRHRQQVGEAAAVEARPGEMLGHQRRLEPVDQPLQRGEMVAIGLGRAPASDMPTP